MSTPEDIQHWGHEDVGLWLRSLGKSHLVQRFRRMNVTGNVLPSLTDTMLCELGVTRAVERAVVLASIKTHAASNE
jgi:hypothetical protein